MGREAGKEYRGARRLRTVPIVFGTGVLLSSMAAPPLAAAAGESPAADRFNAGVEAYHRGAYREAERAFAGAVGDADLGALAAFNLGRAAAERGDWTAAAYWWALTAERAATERLQGLAEERLAEIDAAHSPGMVYTYAGAGYDSNLFLDDDASLADRGDAFGEVLAYGSWRAVGNRRDGLGLQGGVHHRGHASESDFDVTDVHAAVRRHKWMPGAWWEAALGAGATDVGIDGIDRRGEAELLARRPWPGRGWLEAGYRYTHHLGGGDRDYLDGTQHRLRIGYRDREADLRWSVHYELDYHDRDDRRGEDDAGEPFFVSYSPVVHSFRGRVSRRAGPEWEFTLRPEIARAHYADPHIAGGESRRRRDTRLSLEADALHTPAGEPWGVGFRVRFERVESLRLTLPADATAELDEYTAHRVEGLVYVEWLFQ